VGVTDRELKGVERGFSPWRKKRGYRRSAGDDFIPYMTIFFFLLLRRG
jgi:hypothetical protein